MMLTPRKTENGILMLWRGGNPTEIEGGMFNETQRQSMHLAGRLGVLAALRTIFRDHGFVYEGVRSVPNDAFEGAHLLNHAATVAHAELTAVMFWHARPEEVNSMRSSLGLAATALIRDLRHEYTKPVDLDDDGAITRQIVAHAGAVFAPGPDNPNRIPNIRLVEASLELHLPLLTDMPDGSNPMSGNATVI